MTEGYCFNGHPRTPENTRVNARGIHCRPCQVAYAQRYKAKRIALAAQGISIAEARILSTHPRLMSKVDKLDSGCWRWTGFVDRKGYGRTSYEGRRGVLAHKAFYMLLVGPVPPGLVLDHACHNRDQSCAGGPTCQHRRCVNPEHLEAVTSEENSSRGVIGRREACPHGHPYDVANTYLNGGRRFCRACMMRRSAAYKAQKRRERLASKGVAA